MILRPVTHLIHTSRLKDKMTAFKQNAKAGSILLSSHMRDYYGASQLTTITSRRTT